MSKTIKDLLQEGIEAKNNVRELHRIISQAVDDNATLDALNSTSLTAVWRLWLYVFAALSWIQQQTWNLFRKEVDELISKAIPGTDRWLANEVLKFQYGDSLDFDEGTGKYSYHEEDESKKIVKRIAVTSSAGGTVVKVAGEDAGGKAVPLADLEKNSLNAYVRLISFAGANVRVESRSADLLKVYVDVHYSAIHKEADVKAQCIEAINNYLSDLDFNGTFYISRLQDALQAVEGVKDVHFKGIEARTEKGAYAEIKRTYNPLSGYLNIDPDFPIENAAQMSFLPA
jgi:hypothetical protein